MLWVRAIWWAVCQSGLGEVEKQMGKQLTPRKEAILRSLVEEYIRTATPVASEQLQRQYGLPWGAATIRNEMASLEEEGLLFQPHTSAGRMPTDLGYRYFVEHYAAQGGHPALAGGGVHPHRNAGRLRAASAPIRAEAARRRPALRSSFSANTGCRGALR